MNFNFSRLVVLLSFLPLSSFAYTSGGCIDRVQVTSITSPAFVHCQQYHGSVPCDADTLCKWDPTQYYRNYCSGPRKLLAENGAACVAGYVQTAFHPDAYPNPKFKCCQRVNPSPSPSATPSPTVAPTATPSPVSGKCCNPAGIPVPALHPCPTAQAPGRCCNPAGNPVPPMQGSTGACKKGFGKPGHGSR